MQEKTFDQLLFERKGKVLDGDIEPAKRIASEIILEPLAAGISVSARDENHSRLWEFTASEGSLKSHHTLVAVLPKLRDIVTTALAARGLMSSDSKPVDLDQVVARLKVVVAGASQIARDTKVNEKKRHQIATAIDYALRILEVELDMGTKPTST